MRFRSLSGIALLGLGTSCVPPLAQDRSTAAMVTTAPTTPTLLSSTGATPRIGGLFLPAVALAASAGGDTTASPFVLAARDREDGDRARDCLTAAIYYEARSQSVDGQRAVAQVVLNRVRSPAFPGSVCGVVYQGSHLSTGCQFSFTCDGSLLARREPAAWERASQVAGDALAGSVYAPVGTATFYHTTAISPWWAPSLTPVTTIGAHIFYRWPGALGMAAAFTRAYAGLEPIRDGGGAYAVETMENVMRYTFDGTTIAVFRGNIGVAQGAAAAGSAPAGMQSAGRAERGVQIHFGGKADATATPAVAAVEPAAPASAETTNGVSVHHGAPPIEVARAARGEIG